MTQKRGSRKGKYRLEGRAVTRLRHNTPVYHVSSILLLFFFFFPKYLLISSLSFILTHAHFCKFMSIPFFFSVDLRLILLSQLAFLLCQFKQPLAHAPVLPPSNYFYTAEYLRWAMKKIFTKKKHILTLSLI